MEILCAYKEILDSLKIQDGVRIFDDLCSIHDDELKIRYLDELTSSKAKQLLILSLEDTDKREIYMRCFSDEEIYNSAMSVGYNDEILIRYLPFINDDDDCYSMLEKISEANLERCLDYLIKVSDYEDVLDKFLNPERRLRVLRKLNLDNDEISDYLEVQDLEMREYLKRGLFDKSDIEELKPKDEHFEIIKYLDTLPRALTFGIEIECVGDKTLPLKLYFNHIYNYKVEEETSIINGVEFVSNKMSWNNGDLESIYKICDYAKGLNLSTNDVCGGHIHLSSDYLKSYNAWMWFFYLYVAFENILFLISNEKKCLPRSTISYFASPFSQKIYDNLELLNQVANKEELIKVVQKLSEHKKEALNLDNIFKKFNTIEFRMPNSSLNPEVIIENILLYGKLIEISEKLSRLPKTNDLYSLVTKIDDSEEDEKLEIMLRLLFKDENLREAFRERYYVNKKMCENSTSLNLGKNTKSFSLHQINFKS